MTWPVTMKPNGAMTFSSGARYGRTRSGSLLRSDTAATGAKLYMNAEAAGMAETSDAQPPNGRNRKQPQTPPKTMEDHGTPHPTLAAKTGGTKRVVASEEGSRAAADRHTGPVPAGRETAAKVP